MTVGDETSDAVARRSPELLSRHDSALLVVDMQEKLLAAIPGAERLTWNVRRLIDAARLLGIPCHGTEQYPQGLGPTVEPLARLLPPRPAKQRFSCCGCGALLEDWSDQGRYQVLVAGVEAHVCVLQSVLDLLGDGFRVFVAADGVGSRHALDYEMALRRMEANGAVVTTVESVLFEWCETAAAPEFKQLSQLVRELPP